MSVRRQCNRYKEEPYGKDKSDVIKRAKAFYGNGTFLIVKFDSLYFSRRPSLPPFIDPDDAEYYTRGYTKGERWRRI